MSAETLATCLFIFYSNQKRTKERKRRGFGLPSFLFKNSFRSKFDSSVIGDSNLLKACDTELKNFIDYRFLNVCLQSTIKTRLLQGPSVPLTPTFAVYATLVGATNCPLFALKTNLTDSCGGWSPSRLAINES